MKIHILTERFSASTAGIYFCGLKAIPVSESLTTVSYRNKQRTDCFDISIQTNLWPTKSSDRNTLFDGMLIN